VSVLGAGLLLALGAAPAGELPLVGLCAAYSGYDQDGDGKPELARVEPLATAGESGPWVFVLVEARVLEPLEGAPSLRPLLEQHLEDLAIEGWRAALISVELAPSGEHRDGRFLLALREFLRAAHERDALGGVTLVGHFPDALLVRRCNWRKRGDLELDAGTPAARSFDGVPYVRRVPEDVAHRGDIVLGDLDGRWEERYVQERRGIASTIAAFPDGLPSDGGPAAAVERGSVAFEDVFLIDDGSMIVSESCEVPIVILDDRDADRECGPEDASRSNAMAVPEIAVSRIDARGSALRPRRDVLGVDGEGLLDEDGAPQTVRFASAAEVLRCSQVWEHDPSLERRLLAEFFERNHAYRTRPHSAAMRPAAFAHELRSGYDVLAPAADWWSLDKELSDVHGRPGLTEFVSWLKQPAVLRALCAHSDPWGSALQRGDVAELEALVGPAFSWSPEGSTLVPSLEAACAGGKLDFFLLRTLWENGVSQTLAPCLWLYTGCHGVSPPGALKLAYDDPRYGVRQGAESLLFFGGGLALLGRSKVFYDTPRGFAGVLADGGTMGDAWIHYFDVESRAERWSDVGGDIGRKRAYFWSLLGDWTLRLPVDQGWGDFRVRGGRQAR